MPLQRIYGPEESPSGEREDPSLGSVTCLTPYSFPPAAHNRLRATIDRLLSPSSQLSLVLGNLWTGSVGHLVILAAQENVSTNRRDREAEGILMHLSGCQPL